MKYALGRQYSKQEMSQYDGDVVYIHKINDGGYAAQVVIKNEEFKLVPTCPELSNQVGRTFKSLTEVLDFLNS
jgi:hypothetical protein